MGVGIIMAHFAKLDENNIVTNVLVIDDKDVANNGGERSTEAEQWVSDNFEGGVWKQTSYNTNMGKYFDPETGLEDEDQSKAYRKNYAGIGYIYHSDIDGFSPPKPYESWTINSTTGRWQPPIAFPITTTTGVTLTGPLGVSYEQPYNYDWDESNQRWIAYTIDVNGVLENNYIWNSTNLEWEINNG
jgi:hypothetical protein|tara:strand:+ start:430 stop:990 length:561 start_codon:yes stop_codon:yes gene_type:complete